MLKRSFSVVLLNIGLIGAAISPVNVSGFPDYPLEDDDPMFSWPRFPAEAKWVPGREPVVVPEPKLPKPDEIDTIVSRRLHLTEKIQTVYEQIAAKVKTICSKKPTSCQTAHDHLLNAASMKSSVDRSFRLSPLERLIEANRLYKEMQAELVEVQALM